MSPQLLDRVRETLQEFLANKGLRRTSQRDAIIEAAFGSADHFSADELIERARKIEPSVSRATVYRTIPLLVESGLLHELDLGGGTQLYDPNFVERPHHNHLICLDCRQIIEFEDANIEVLENCISRRLGFSPTKKSIVIAARCDELRLRGRCEKRARASRPAPKVPAAKPCAT